MTKKKEEGALPAPKGTRSDWSERVEKAREARKVGKEHRKDSPIGASQEANRRAPRR